MIFKADLVQHRKRAVTARQVISRGGIAALVAAAFLSVTAYAGANSSTKTIVKTDPSTKPNAGAPVAAKANITTNADAAILQQADALERANKLEEASQALSKAIVENGNNRAFRAAHARILVGLGDGVDAEAEARRALSLGYPADQLRHVLGHAILLQNEPERALQVLEAGPVATIYAGEAHRIAGNAHLDLGDFDGARASFDLSIKNNPRSSMLWMDIARFRNSNADLGGAIQAIDQALTINRNNISALFIKANLVRDREGLVPSLIWYERVIAANPKHLGAQLEYAATLGDIGRYEDMLATTRAVLRIDKSNPRAYLLQATMAARGGNYNLAKTLLFKIGNKLDAVPAYLLVSAAVEYELGNYNIASELADRLLSIQPDNFTARRLLAVSTYAAQEAEQSWEVINPILNRPDTDSWSIMLGGLAMQDQSKWKEAIPILDRATNFRRGAAIAFGETDSAAILAADAAANPLNARIVIPYIRSQVNLGRTAAALNAAQRLQNANMGVPEAHMLVGDIELAANRVPQAVKDYERSTALRFGEAAALRLANAYDQKGDVAAAEQTLENFIQRNPGNMPAQRALASIYVQRKDWPKAVASLEMVRERLGNSDALLLTELGWAKMGMGRPREAVTYFRHAYEIQPMNPNITHGLGWSVHRAGLNHNIAKDLLEKAAIMQPDNKLYQERLAQVRQAK